MYIQEERVYRVRDMDELQQLLFVLSLCRGALSSYRPSHHYY